MTVATDVPSRSQACRNLWPSASRSVCGTASSAALAAPSGFTVESMSRGALGVVDKWLDAVNRADAEQVQQLSAEDVEIEGPRGVVRGRSVLADWLARAGFSAQSRRWFCGEDGGVVVEQDACWVDVATGAEQARAVVASRFEVRDGRVVRYARHDDLDHALTVAGLSTGDEVSNRAENDPPRRS